MQLYARQVLDDCRHALSELNTLPMGKEWRIRWAAIHGLLMTVNDVLKDHDIELSDAHKIAINKVYQTKVKGKNIPIYIEFINNGRNALLHEYKFDAGQNIVVNPGTIHADLSTGKQRSATYPDNVDYTITGEGPYKCRDARELAQEAIDWWEECIKEIEEEYRKHQ